MSGFDFGSGGVPIPSDIVVEDGYLVLYRSDGSRKALIPAPSAGVAGPAGRGVSSTAIVAGDLVVTFSDGSTVNAGHVLGEPGTEGAAGRGIAAAEVNAGHLVLTYSDGTTATLGSIVGPAGATGRGISSSVVQAGRLVLTYTDGATADLGNVVGAAGAAGRGIASTAITNGHLVVTYTDGTSEDKGQVVGAAGATGATPWASVAPWAANTTYTAGPPASVVTFGGGCYVAAPSAGTYTSGATFDAGKWVQIASPANLTTFRRVYVSSVELTGSNGSYGFAGAVPAGATEVEVECVGGGASGYSLRTDNNLPGHGGNPGQVTRRRLRVADVPSPIAVTIGAGGMASSRTSGRCYSNRGDDTAFGTLLKARGGEGGSYAALSDLPPGIGILPGDVPSGPAGRANGLTANGTGQVPDYLKGTASMGPGGGGAGIQNGSDGYQAGGAGGDSGIHLPASTKQGGLGGSGNAAYTYPGANASDVWGYGSGGGGGYWNGGAGGSGGIPGGGGGGGGGNGGAGGRGAIRLHFYRYEAP